MVELVPTTPGDPFGLPIHQNHLQDTGKCPLPSTGVVNMAQIVAGPLELLWPGRNISNMNVPIQVYVPKQWIHKEPHQVFKPPFHKTSLGLGPTVLISDLIYWKTICASLAQCATEIQGTGSVHRVDVLSTDIIIKKETG